MKAQLLFDMPSHCTLCPVHLWDKDKDEMLCQAVVDLVDNGDHIEIKAKSRSDWYEVPKPDWCPLKEIKDSATEITTILRQHEVSDKTLLDVLKEREKEVRGRRTSEEVLKQAARTSHLFNGRERDEIQTHNRGN